MAGNDSKLKWGRLAVAVTLGLSAGLAVIAYSPDATAQTTEVRRYDLKAGTLDEALSQFGLQSGVQILAPPELVIGHRVQAVGGELTSVQVLERLLAGTGLSWERVNEKTVVIKRAESRAPAPESQPRSPRQTESASAEQTTPTRLEAVHVTGSRLPRADVEGPVPVNIYTREDIQRSGQQTVVDYLNTLPEVSMGTPERGPVFSGQTTVRLRGLPLGTTLVLINGRRLESGGGTAYYGGYFDLNSLPSSLIERIEIVPEGSSAIYGSDALAGVVNIVLRKDFDGAEVNARYGAASGTDERSFDLALGKSWERGGFSLVGAWYRRGELGSQEREQASSVQHGGYVVENCNPGSVYSVDGGNLPGLDSPFAAVRPGEHAVPALSDFTAGELNRCRLYYTGALIPPAERAALLLSGHYQLSPSVELFTEIAYGRYDQFYSIGHKTLSNVIVPASNAFNPFGVDVTVNSLVAAPGAEQGSDNRTTFFRPLIGARGGFADSWEWELSAWQSGTRLDANDHTGQSNLARRNEALASSDPATALNLFTGGPPASEAILRGIYPVDARLYRGKSSVGNFYLRGSLFQLPAGPAAMVIGAEYQRNELTWKSLTNPQVPESNFSYRRSSHSAFSELRIPLLAGGEGRQGGDRLAISGALRYDDDEYFGGQFTPQYAIEWRPARTLLLRGSHAEAFKAPGANYLFHPTTTYPDICCVIDPQNGGNRVAYAMVFAGNPDLAPETGRSSSIGFVWSPNSGLNASVTWWKISQSNRVTTLFPQTVVDNEGIFPGGVVRDPVTNAIVSVRRGYFNFGNMDVAGIDVGLEYSLETSAGRFSPAVRLSRMHRYDAEIAPDTPVTDRLGSAVQDGWAPRLKSTVSLGWRSPAELLSASLSGRYVGSYVDYQDAGATERKLGDFWYWDLTGRYDLGSRLGAHSAWLRRSYLQISAVNILDKLPVYSAYDSGLMGYDPTQYDIRGRFIAVSFGARF